MKQTLTCCERPVAIAQRYADLANGVMAFAEASYRIVVAKGNYARLARSSDYQVWSVGGCPCLQACLRPLSWTSARHGRRYRI